MSIEVMSWVLRNSEATLGARLVLLALADHAHADGSEAYPSVETLMRHARMTRRGIQKALRRLELDGAIVQEGHGRNGTTCWRIVMGANFETRGANEVRPRGEHNDARGANITTRGGERGSPNPSIRTVQEQPPRKPLSAVADEERPDVAFLCHLLGDLIRGNDPKAKPRTDSDGWRKACRLLLDADGRSPAEVEAVIRWSQADSFWLSNVLSMPKLREKFPMLALRMNADARKPGGRDDPWSTENILAAGRRLAHDV